MADGSGSTGWAYDPMGRVPKEQQTIATVTKTMGYGYNYDGSLASLTYPSGRVVTYGVDSLGRPGLAVDQASNYSYAQSASYAAQGALGSVLNGQTGHLQWDHVQPGVQQSPVAILALGFLLERHGA